MFTNMHMPTFKHCTSGIGVPSSLLHCFCHIACRKGQSSKYNCQNSLFIIVRYCSTLFSCSFSKPRTLKIPTCKAHASRKINCQKKCNMLFIVSEKSEFVNMYDFFFSAGQLCFLQSLKILLSLSTALSFRTEPCFSPFLYFSFLAIGVVLVYLFSDRS